MNRPASALLLPTLQCLAAAALFGASTPLSKSLLATLGPLSLAGLLYLGAAAAALPAAVHDVRKASWGDRRQRLLLLGAVVFGGGLAPVLLLMGLMAAPAASVSLWLNLEVVATTFIAAAFFHEHIDRRTGLAAALVLLGGVALTAHGGVAGIRAGMLVALACVCWGLDNNFTAVVDGFTPPQTTCIKGLFAGTVNLGLGLALGERLPGPGSVWPALLVGGACYGASIILYISGAQQLGASRSQLLFATSGLFGALLAWSFLGERVAGAQLAAGALMVSGLAMMLTARHEHSHTHERLSHTHSHRHDDGHHTHVHPGLPAWVRHTHPHEHEPLAHSHPHAPDLHHRHEHGRTLTDPSQGTPPDVPRGIVTEP
jgi:drug/metabolite transporter (DMT)-like permease